MIFYPEEIKELKKIVKPWQIGAGIFKENTPADVLIAHKKIIDWLKKESDGIQ